MDMLVDIKYVCTDSGSTLPSLLVGCTDKKGTQKCRLNSFDNLREIRELNDVKRDSVRGMCGDFITILLETRGVYRI